MEEAPQGSQPENYARRPYQEELIEKALIPGQNIVCALGTGTGKTYIATQVIQRLQCEIMDDWDLGGKRTVFVVPSVPLVEQQSKVLESFTGLSTGAYHGSQGVDEWTVDVWEVEFRENRILVMVAEICQNLLTSAILPTSRINLLVMDECHHAAENHPYRGIMRLLMGKPALERPRVLGLTASVINIKLGKKGDRDFNLPDNLKLKKYIKDLESCMGCTVWTSEHDSLAAHSAHAQPIVVQYAAFPSTGKVLEAEQILQALVDFLAAAQLEKRPQLAGHLSFSPFDPNKKAKEWLNYLKNAVVQVINCLKVLGPFCASLAAGNLLKSLRYMHTQKIFGASGNSLNPHQLAVTALESFGWKLDNDFHLKSLSPGYSRDLWQLTTPKVQILMMQINQCRTDALIADSPTDEEDNVDKKFCCIVFVRERMNAWALYQLLKRMGSSKDKEFGYINCVFCVGGVTQSGTEETAGEKASVSLRQLRETLRKFSTGVSNILVATEVVEEGLDVGHCNLIVRFDPPQTYRSYVQSKGRARKMDSKYLMLVEDRVHDKFVTGDLAEFQALDETMQQHCLERTAPTEADREEHFSDEYCPPFHPPGTDAVITVNTALWVLQKYVSTLPNDSMTCTMYMQEVKLGPAAFVCTVHLPLSAAVKEPVKGTVQKSATAAKKVAALECCKRLFALGQLQLKTLLPFDRDSWKADVVDFMGAHQREKLPKDTPAPGTRKRFQQYGKRVPDCFANSPIGVSGSATFLYTIRLTLTGHILADSNDRLEYDQSVTLGLLSRDLLPNLPEWPIYIRFREFSVKLELAKTFCFDEKQLNAVKACHFAIFNDVIGYGAREDLTSLQAEIGNTLFAVPLKMDSTGGYVMDWEAINRLATPGCFSPNLLPEQDRKRRGVRGKDFQDAVVTTNFRGDIERFYVLRVMVKMNPHSMSGFEETSAEYLLRNNGISVQIADQPMLDLRPCSKGLNFLHPKPAETVEAKSPKKNFFFVPELFNILPLSGVLYFKCRLLPTILYRIQSFANTWVLHAVLREKSQIGAAVPESGQLKPLENDHRFRGLYSASLVVAASGGDRPAPVVVGKSSLPQRMEVDSTTPSGSPDLEEDADASDSDDSHGLFYQDYLQREFYRKQQDRINQRKHFPTGLMPIISGISARQTVKKSTWALTAPNGCHSRLRPPPFLLDAEFNSDSSKKPFPQVTSVLTALTTARAGDNFDMERLETMGDSFLKMATCLYLFQKYPNYHEGRLDHLKGYQVSNYNLYRLGKELGIPQYVICRPLDPLVNFTPPGYVPLGARAQLDLNDKSLADVMEALIGMVLMECGCGGALKFMSSLGLKVEMGGKSVLGCGRAEAAPRAMLRNDPEAELLLGHLTTRFDEFEEQIGYRFNQRGYLLQAFTHSSFTENRITDCYQRLEFIGDAILDFLVTRYLFSEVKKYLSPGELTDLRSALVNNKTFSLLAIKNNYHNHLNHHSTIIFGVIKKYVEEARLENADICPIADDMLFLDIDDSSDEFEGYNPAEDPKTLGDIWESVAGAIFIDSGYSLDAVWKVYYTLMTERIEFCVQHCPKNPVRVLMEREPGKVVFDKKAEILSNRQARVSVEVCGTVYKGIGNNARMAKCAAAKGALRALGDTTVVW